MHTFLPTHALTHTHTGACICSRFYIHTLNYLNLHITYNTISEIHMHDYIPQVRERHFNNCGGPAVNLTFNIFLVS